MKKYFLRAIITLGGLFALATGVQADSGDIVVHIQQSFVAGGKALPPGTYKIHQGFPDTFQALVLRGDEPGTPVLLLPATHVESSTERARVKLTRVGDVYYLTEVATERGVFVLPLPDAVKRTAKARDLDRMSSSGSN